MKCKSMAAAGALLLVASAAQAQATFDQSVFVTCREAHAMAPDARKALALYLADQAARSATKLNEAATGVTQQTKWIRERAKVLTEEIRAIRA